ncbi:MAG TPA: hypothetical protein VMA73_27230 [Streptosporangiaceae bacterium]|nr:hypothetical protein [Streptosporangiaceae bacterium]
MTTGGFTVGAWDVVGIDDIASGFYRFALGSALPDLVESRVLVTPGPTARWLDDPADSHG